MGSNNVVELVGNLGAELELRFTRTGKAVANGSLATHEVFKVDGEERRTTDWHRIVLWNEQAQKAANSVPKGAFVKVRGKLKTDVWQDADGKRRETTKVHVFPGFFKVFKKKDGDEGAPNIVEEPQQDGLFSEDDMPY